MQGDRLSLERAYLQRRDDHVAVHLGSRVMIQRVVAVVAVQRGELVDLSGAADFELRIQGDKSGLPTVTSLDCTVSSTVSGVEAAAVYAGDQVRRLGVACRQREQEQKGGAAAHRVVS